MCPGLILINLSSNEIWTVPQTSFIYFLFTFFTGSVHVLFEKLINYNIFFKCTDLGQIMNTDEVKFPYNFFFVFDY